MVMLLSAVVRLISIHALREEGDVSAWIFQPARRYFYPRPPRGGRPRNFWTISFQEQFLSTPSARRATPCIQFLPAHFFYFYPRPPRGGRQPTDGREGVYRKISIHALREEGDATFFTRVVKRVKFLSTPSARRATTCPSRPAAARWYFYPRPPRGGRRWGSGSV